MYYDWEINWNVTVYMYLVELIRGMHKWLSPL